MTLGNQITRCRACNNRDFKENLDMPGVICGNCGLVHDGEDWASTNIDESVPENEYEHNESETQESDWRNEITIQDASDQQLVRVLTVIDNLSEHLVLSNDDRVSAAELLTEVWNKKLMHGRKLETVVAGGVYLTCRKSGRPRPSHAVATAAGVDESDLKQASRMLVRELQVQIDPPGPEAYIPYLGQQLGLSEQIRAAAFDMFSENLQIGGNPAGIAVAGLYTACNQHSEKLTLTEAGEAAGVTKETVWRKSQQM